ncbi:MAG: ROK family protein [Helicobacteraceae bacterium]|jgi:glucokinase|nr:ROK family protein [Helicobacteraceae bacterium]
MKLVFDIGGTNVRRGILEGGEFLRIDKFRTADRDLKSRVESSCAEVLAEFSGKIDFVGASFAGQTARNRLISAPNIDLGGLKGASFAEFIREKFALKAAVDNDLKCAALAEAVLRPNARAIFTLFVGTGVGGAFVENGVLTRGGGNNAGEIGHIPFEKTPFACGCGGADCLEASASGSGVAKWARYYDLKAENLSEIEAIINTSEKAREILDRFDRGISHAIRTIAALFNPDVIVLGGGVAANDRVLKAAQNALKNAFAPSREILVEASSLGDQANLLGAALLEKL